MILGDETIGDAEESVVPAHHVMHDQFDVISWDQSDRSSPRMDKRWCTPFGVKTSSSICGCSRLTESRVISWRSLLPNKSSALAGRQMAKDCWAGGATTSRTSYFFAILLN